MLLTRGVSPKNIEKSAKALAKASESDWHSVKYNMQAVSYLMTQNYTNEEIIALGRLKVRELYKKAKREKNGDPLTLMGWRVTPDTKYAVESEVLRHCKILGIKDSETYWTWWHSEASMWSPPQLRHSAGMPILKRAR